MINNAINSIVTNVINNLQLSTEPREERGNYLLNLEKNEAR